MTCYESVTMIDRRDDETGCSGNGMQDGKKNTLCSNHSVAGNLIVVKRAIRNGSLERSALIEMISDELCSDVGNIPSVNQLAERLCVSSRTLSRRLRSSQTTYRTLVSDVKRRTADRLLRETGISVSEVSFALGYADCSNFIKAFKRWTGLTPYEYRANYKNGLLVGMPK